MTNFLPFGNRAFGIIPERPLTDTQKEVIALNIQVVKRVLGLRSTTEAEFVRLSGEEKLKCFFAEGSAVAKNLMPTAIMRVKEGPNPSLPFAIMPFSPAEVLDNAWEMVAPIEAKYGVKVSLCSNALMGNGWADATIWDHEGNCLFTKIAVSPAMALCRAALALVDEREEKPNGNV